MDYRSVFALSIILCLLLANLSNVSSAVVPVRSNMRQPVSGAHATGQRRHQRRRRRQFDDQQPQQFQQQGFDVMDNTNAQAQPNGMSNAQPNGMFNAQPNGVSNADPNAGLGNNAYFSGGDDMQKKKRR